MKYLKKQILILFIFFLSLLISLGFVSVVECGNIPTNGCIVSSSLLGGYYE